MALCDLCKSIDLSKLSNKDGEHFQHYKIHKDLLLSRDRGCPLCGLFVKAFRRGMDHPGTGITLRLEPYSASSSRRPDEIEKIHYERCNLHGGCISEMYDSIEGPYLELSELIPNSRSYIGSASIVEPEVIRKSVGK